MPRLVLLLLLVYVALDCSAPSTRTRGESPSETQPDVVPRLSVPASAPGEAIVDPRREEIRLREKLIRVDSLPFDYTASTRLIPSRIIRANGHDIEVSVAAVNRGTRAVKVQVGGCAVELFAYRRGLSFAYPVWRSSKRSPWPGGFTYECDFSRANPVVQPGATFQPKQFTRSFPVSELLADSLPNGEYDFAVRVRLNWGQSREIPAGRLSLALERAALPASRLTEHITYEALPATVASGGEQLVFGGTATLTHAGGTLYRVSPGCALQVLAYRDRAARDTLPPVRESWRSRAQPCEPPIQVTLQCGQFHRVEARESPRQILGDSLPAGEYHFAVIFHGDRHVVRLAAGSATLGRDVASVPRRNTASVDDTARRREVNELCARRFNRMRGRAP